MREPLDLGLIEVSLRSPSRSNQWRTEAPSWLASRPARESENLKTVWPSRARPFRNEKACSPLCECGPLW